MALFALLITQIFWAQTTTETFEGLSSKATTFTSNGQVFNITSQAQGPFDINEKFPGTGWNGTAADGKYIDNDEHAVIGNPVAFSISTANATPFKLNSFWLFLANNFDLNTTGTVTIIGSLGGVPQYTAVSPPSFNNTNIAVNNGFTLINMTTFGGANNTTTPIDKVEIITTNNFSYVALDAFTWTKVTAVPTVTTATATVVGAVKATLGGNVTADGGVTVTERGIVWGTAANPTTSNNKIIIGSGTGSFSAVISSLPPNTLINFRAYATNTTGTGYGSNLTFTTNTALTAPAVTPKNNVACFGASTGNATVTPSGGLPPYDYSWSPAGGTNATTIQLPVGSYTCTVTDSEGTQITRNAIITQPPGLTVTPVTQTNIACFGGATGSATVSVSGGAGGYTYSWSRSASTTATATNLSAGTHTVTVTDANGCTKQQSFTLAPGIEIVTSVAGQTNETCFGESDGSATVSATGGAGGFTYFWSDSKGTAATATGLSPGSYTVTITDVNNCSKTQPVVIQAATAIVATPRQTNVSCNGGSNGSATVDVIGGTGLYTYSWAPTGGAAKTATGLTQGTYTVTITDGNQCFTTQSFTITQPNNIITSVASQTNESCFEESDGSATVSATGGAGGFTYSWAPSGGTAATATGLAPDTYIVTITDGNGCSKDQTVVIQAATKIVAIPDEQTNVTCNGGFDGSATVSASGGSGIYTYSWSPSGGIGVKASGLTAGPYTVTVTDENNCSTTQSFTITEPTASILSITRSGNILTADQAGATYQWFTCPGTDIIGEVGQSFTPTANGSYGVAITLNGCTLLAPCVNVTSLATVDFEEKSKFMIYPNPSQGIVTIKTDYDTDVSIINQSGQVVKTAKVTADNTNTINVENLSDGIYFIREMKGNKPATYKLILKK